MTEMKYRDKVQGNAFALVQIFNAIHSPPFSAPAELRITIWGRPIWGHLIFNICILSMKNYRVSLNGTSPFVPSKGGCGRLG